MSASTDMTAEQLLDLAWRTAQTCRERQRRVAARAEEDRARLAALHAHIDKLERENARLATTEKRASVVALSLAETKSAGADVIVADAEARRVTAEQRAIAAESQAERLERELADAEVRGALAVFRAVEQAVSSGRAVPVPSDERTWPTVAARICAEACGQRPPICAHCGRTATDCMAASVVSAKGSK